MGLLPNADQPDYKVFDPNTSYRSAAERLLVADSRSPVWRYQRPLLRKPPLRSRQLEGIDDPQRTHAQKRIFQILAVTSLIVQQE